jgi:hypothetical protein
MFRTLPETILRVSTSGGGPTVREKDLKLLIVGSLVGTQPSSHRAAAVESLD